MIIVSVSSLLLSLLLSQYQTSVINILMKFTLNSDLDRERKVNVVYVDYDGDEERVFP
jgi:hypothetical protein